MIYDTLVEQTITNIEGKPPEIIHNIATTTVEDVAYMLYIADKEREYLLRCDGQSNAVCFRAEDYNLLHQLFPDIFEEPKESSEEE